MLANVAERRRTGKSTTGQNQTPQPSVLKENKTNPTTKKSLVIIVASRIVAPIAPTHSSVCKECGLLVWKRAAARLATQLDRLEDFRNLRAGLSRRFLIELMGMDDRVRLLST